MANKEVKESNVNPEEKTATPVEPVVAEVVAESPVTAEVSVEAAASDEATAETTDAAAAPKKKKRKFRRQVQKGRAYVKSTYNNTLVSLTDMHGGLLAWSSAGLLGFKGAKKATTFAAAQVVNDVNEKVQKYGLKDIDVFVKGVGSGREAAIRALAQKGYNLMMIKDITPIPHNGCRPKKPRRV